MLVFPKIWRALFFWNTHFEIRSFALLPKKSIKKRSKNIHENNDFENWNGTENGFVPNEKNSAFAKKQLLEKYSNK